MNLLILDCETTGLKSGEHKMIEVAAVLYNVETKTALASLQTLVYNHENQCEHINNISVASLELVKGTEVPYYETLRHMANCADYIVAHNAPFDKGFVEVTIGDLGKPWICSKADLKFPLAGKSSRLGHLAYDHNIPVLNAHRGLDDVNILISLLGVLTPEELADQIYNASLPKRLYEAKTSYEERELPKQAGFHWDAGVRAWRKYMNEKEASRISTFPITVIE
jgi:DNA polymerase-3 subunit epsilon